MAPPALESALFLPDTRGVAGNVFLSGPWTWIIGAVVVVFLLWRAGHWIRSHAPVHKDPKRLFTNAERLKAFQRAGNRCEHKPLLWFRCSRAPTAGDHIYPHSLGGATVMTNCQALCRRHNLRKSNRVPSAFYLARLERRRRQYFPGGEPYKIVWRYRR